MYKIIIFLLFILFLINSCVDTNIYQLNINVKKFKSKDDLANWIIDNIKYKNDPENIWQSPNETLKLRTGDCEDFCILYAFMLYYYNHNKVEIYCYESKNLHGRHCLIKNNDNFFEPQLNIYLDKNYDTFKNENKTYNFDYIFLHYAY